MERFNSNKLKDVESKERLPVEVSSRLAHLADIEAEVEINSASGTIRENI
jgi:hypothetical protein